MPFKIKCTRNYRIKEKNRSVNLEPIWISESSLMYSKKVQQESEYLSI